MTSQTSVNQFPNQKSVSYTKLPTDDKDPPETELCDTDSLEGSSEPDRNHYVTDTGTLENVDPENNGLTRENGTPDHCTDLVYDDDHFSQSNSSLTGSIDIGDICLSPTDTINSFSTDNSTNSLRRSKSFAEEKVSNKDLNDKEISKKLSKRYHLDLSRVTSRVKSLPLRKDACDHKTQQRGRSCMYRRVSDDSCGIRDTLTSRMRYEKGHVAHVAHEMQECSPDEYMTPTQRKDIEIKQLKREVKYLKKDVEDKNNEIELLKQNLDKEAAILIEQKENDKKDLRMELDILQQKYEDLVETHDKSLEEITRLQNSVGTLKESMSARERKNAEIYLEMYKKGQESAKFERNEELERLAAKPGGHSAVTIRELLEKLMNTEMELAKWQSMRRKEAYESVKKPETDAAATIRFLKDSFFHYLTDLEESDNHLRAIIKIFNFTDPQKKRIRKAIIERRKRKSTL